MLSFALSYDESVAIRYPKGEAYQGLEEYKAPINYGKSEIIHKEKDIAILAVGSMVKTGVTVTKLLKEQGLNVTLVNVRFVSPIDYQMFDELIKDHTIFITMEDNVRTGGFGQQVSDYMFKYQNQGIKLINFSIPDKFIDQGSVDELYNELGLNGTSIAEKILDDIQLL